MKGTCDVCGQRRTVHRNRKTGKAICHNCYQIARYRDPSTHEKCFECGEVKPVAMRNETGKAICHNCYQIARYRDPSTHEKCFECGEVKPVAMRNETGKAICHNCYQTKRLEYGICMIRIGGVGLKEKIRTWIDLYSSDLMRV